MLRLPKRISKIKTDSGYAVLEKIPSDDIIFAPYQRYRVKSMKIRTFSSENVAQKYFSETLRELAGGVDDD